MSFGYQTPMKSVVLSPNKSRGNKEDFRTKYKTEKCKFYELGNCRYGDKCAFAHGESEVKSKTHVPQNYKTK